MRSMMTEPDSTAGRARIVEGRGPCPRTLDDARTARPLQRTDDETIGRNRTMAKIITRTFELSLGHRFRLYADWVARRERREAEAARAAVAAKGRRAQANAAG